MSKVSMAKRKEFYRKNVSPIIEVMMADIMREMPENITDFMGKWIKTKATNLEKEVKNRKSHRRPEGVESSDDDEDDEVEMETIKRPSKTNVKNGRSSVSAEVFGMWNKKKAYVPRVVNKTKEVKDKIRERLNKAFMFQTMDDKDKRIVLNAMEEMKYKKGDSVIKQGDDGDVLYVVDTGSLDCSKVFPGNDKETYLKTYYPGESFGELALLYNAPRAASIVAKEDCILYALDRECFNAIVKGAAVKKREKYEDFLKKVELLDSLDSYEKSKICDCLQSQKFKPGDYIIREGEKGNTFFFMEEGEAYASKKNSKGAEEKVFEYKANDYFGELALLKDEPRAASIIALTPITVAWIDRLAFKRLLGPLEKILERNSSKYAKYMKGK